MKKKTELSLRELQVLRLLSEGSSTKEIAVELKITDRTAETHRRNINLKLDTHNATEAVYKAKQLKLILKMHYVVFGIAGKNKMPDFSHRKRRVERLHF